MQFAVATEPLGTGGHIPLHFVEWLGMGGHRRSPKVNENELKADMRSLTQSLRRLQTDSPCNDSFLQISNAEELLAWQPLDSPTRTN